MDGRDPPRVAARRRRATRRPARSSPRTPRVGPAARRFAPAWRLFAPATNTTAPTTTTPPPPPFVRSIASDGDDDAEDDGSPRPGGWPTAAATPSPTPRGIEPATGETPSRRTLGKLRRSRRRAATTALASRFSSLIRRQLLVTRFGCSCVKVVYHRTERADVDMTKISRIAVLASTGQI